MLAITSDLVFGHVMFSNPKYVKRLIHYITNIPLQELEGLKYLDTNLKEENINLKHPRSDILLEVGNTYINIEMNNHPDKEYIEKNITYLFSIHNQNNKRSKKYVLGKKYILINLDYYGKVGNAIINRYILTNGKQRYPVETEIYHIKLDYTDRIEYTESVNEEILKYLKIMILTNKNDLIKISKGDEILENLVRDMIHYEAKDIPFGYRDVEEEREWMMNSIKDRYTEEGIKKGEARGIKQGIEQGITQGIEQANMTTAHNLLNMGMKPTQIAQATGLPVTTIMKL